MRAEIVAEPELYENKLIVNNERQNRKGKMQKSILKIKEVNITTHPEKDRIGKSENSPLLPVSDSPPDIINNDEGKSYLWDVNTGETLSINSDKRTMGNPASTISVINSRKIIRDSIEKARIYPPLARKKGIQGKVILEFSIRPDGEIDEIRIVKGSGFEILDSMSIETIKRSAPLPYVSGRIEIPMIYRLE